MTDVYGDTIKNFHPMMAFMAKKHGDPIDQLVARLLNLRWDAQVTSGMVVEDSEAYALAVHTALVADAILVQVHKLRHYDILESIVENFDAETPLLLDDGLAIDKAPNVLEHVEFYMELADSCKRQLGSDEVWLARKQVEPASSAPPSIDWTVGWHPRHSGQ